MLVQKLLSVSPDYPDAPREGIRRILEQVTGKPFASDEPIDTSLIQSIRMGTTVATNALLERKGARCALVVTRGFRDLLEIGNQARPDIFDLRIERPDLLYEAVVEVDERVRVITEAHTRIPEDDLLKQDVLEEKTATTGEKVLILQRPDPGKVKAGLESVFSRGISSICVALMHSYSFPEHEKTIAQIAQEIGFSNISLSSQLIPMVKVVPRGFTACADAYLTPCITEYLQQFVKGFDCNLLKNVSISFMQSDGGLASIDAFKGCRAVLSGPAGGVVGFSSTSQEEFGDKPFIGFDMGGTSTDVCRFHSSFEHIFENVTAGVTIQAPQLDINTVAAGGGSRLIFRSGMFFVGPESTGADPGPACYRRGGPLAVTDANLVLGRLIPEFFPKIFGPSYNESISIEASGALFKKLTDEINSDNGLNYSIEEVASGFIAVANEAMCRPIRALTQSRGFDASSHVLSCFGGAGAQHACAIARNLGIDTVFIHKYSGILSAFGLASAKEVREEMEPCAKVYESSDFSWFRERLEILASRAKEKLTKLCSQDGSLSFEKYLSLRYEGTSTNLMILVQSNSGKSVLQSFLDKHQREYGFSLNAPILVDDIRVRCILSTSRAENPRTSPPRKKSKASQELAPPRSTKCFFSESGWTVCPAFQLDSLERGSLINGPAIIVHDTTTILVEPGCTCTITNQGNVIIKVPSDSKLASQNLSVCNPITLSIFSHRFMSIAEQMGRCLQETSVSTNIKERLDFSCAIFDPDGGLVANAPHLPVHLGSMQEAVKFQVHHLGSDWGRSDVVLSNHPHAGGSHLPDITVMTKVCSSDSDQVLFYLASRGHHSDIGGISPGSMPPFSKSLSEEGCAIVSLKIVENGRFNETAISALLRNSGSRGISDNLSDLKAQVAANHKGKTLLEDLISEYGLETVHGYMKFIQQNAELSVRDLLKSTAKKMTSTELVASDYLDDGSEIRLRVSIDASEGSSVFDFTGTSNQVYGNWNSPKSVVFSAIIYCLRCMINYDIPLNQGCLDPVKVVIPESCLLSPSPDAAVVGGNVLTSQRITDVIFKAFETCAASQGCMNNLTFGDDTFGYYETIAGGTGAGPNWNGRNGVHSHMTNTRITDPEIFERRYPVMLRRFLLRPDSGGKGEYSGGDGVIREIEFLKKLSVSILSERRCFRPYGLHGGAPALPGKNLLIRKQDGIVLNLGGKNQYSADAGDRIVIMTPGGGGYGLSSSYRHQAQVSHRRASLDSGSINLFHGKQESA